MILSLLGSTLTTRQQDGDNNDSLNELPFVQVCPLFCATILQLKMSAVHVS